MTIHVHEDCSLIRTTQTTDTLTSSQLCPKFLKSGHLTNQDTTLSTKGGVLTGGSPISQRSPSGRAPVTCPVAEPLASSLTEYSHLRDTGGRGEGEMG